MTLHELSSVTGLTKTTAHRLLAALESEGLIARGSTPSAYRLGPAVIALGARALRTSDLRAAVRHHLIEVAETTSETATLEVLSDDRMLILDEVSGRHLVSATAEIGTQWPVHATSTGKALLAAMPDEQARSLLESALNRHSVQGKPISSSSWTSSKRLVGTATQPLSRSWSLASSRLELPFVGRWGNPSGPSASVVRRVASNASDTRSWGR